MNGDIVANILNVVKTASDKEVILKALVKLRTDLVKDRDGIVLFRECGGIPPVVRLLNRPHEKILEVALSILGNCCTDAKCCTEALENKLLPPLLIVLKSVPNPVVQCRGCRLLGNLAKDNNLQLANHSAALSQSLCLILEESTDEIQTTIMAARAAKFLLLEKQFLKYFIENHGFKILLQIFLKVIKNPDSSREVENEISKPTGRKSCQPREEYFKEVARHLEGVRSDIFDKHMEERDKKSNEFLIPGEKTEIDLINEILKCFQTISAAQSHVPIMEVHSTDLGLSGIVFFSDDESPFRSTALRIVSNFSKNPLSIAALSAANAVSAACDLLTSNNLKTPLSEPEVRYCINIICILAGDACNRSKIRRSGALRRLVQKAKVTKSCTEVSMILYALNHFQYDHMSMHLLLQEGLVGILINELDAYLNSSDKQRQEKCEEKKRISRKRKSERSPISSYKNPKIWADMFEPDSPSGSPKNILSPGSPCSSRSLSPVSMSSRNFYDMECESDNYSPVCSGDEDDSGDERKSHDEDVMKLLAVASQSESNTDETMLDKEEDEDGNQDVVNLKIPVSGNLPTSAIDIIDNLLLRVSLLTEHRGELGHPQTLKTILQAISAFGIQGNTFGNTLTNILSEIQFFVPIVKQDIIYRLYKMTQIDDLQSAANNFLDKLTCVGQSGYGRGELARLLMKCENNVQKRAAIALQSAANNFLDKLTCVGQSGYGRGELARLLMKCENNVQKRAAIAVSFIIKNAKYIYQLLTENGALYILINAILDKNEEYSLEAADAITSLSSTLGILRPVWDAFLFNSEREFDESTEFPVPYNGGSDVELKFVLHRGCSKIPIKFNKRLLTENSEVFNSMLNSSFKEGNEGEIHLTNYSVHGIKYFLNCVKLMSESKCLTFPPIYHFDSLLESYELSRMYIMDDLEKDLFGMIVCRLSPRTCLKVFEWCLKNHNQDLSELTINYYLCGLIEDDVRVQLFREADYSSVSKEWNQMIIDTVLVKCQNRIYEPLPVTSQVF